MNFELFWGNVVKVWTEYWDVLLLDGLVVTLELTAIAVAMGVLLGTGVAILKMSRV